MSAGGDTTADDGRSRSTDLTTTFTVAGLALIVVLTVVAAVAVSSRTWEVARIEAESSAERAAVVIGAEVTKAIAAVDAASRTDDPGAADVPSPLRSLEWVPAGGADDVGSDETVSLRDPAVAVALASARDTGVSVLSAPTPGSSPGAVIVRAQYRRNGVLANDASTATTSARRTELAGHVVGVLDVEGLLDVAAIDDVRLTDGPAVLAGAAEPANEEIRAAVPLLDRRWQVAVAVTPPSTALVWLLVGIGTALGAVAVGAHRVSRSAASRSRAAAVRAAARAEAVLAYTAVTQESNDLGHVVPALAIELTDRLGLAGISLSVVADDGRLREVFAHGDLPDRSAPADRLPSGAVPGDTVAIRLRRAERPIGDLRVRSGRAMGPDDIDQLRIVGELITSTVISSRSSEQQQDAVIRLRTLDELKTSFLGTASHELRTPVTAIAGFAHMLSTRWDTLTDADRRIFADRIASNARVLEALVQDLLDFALLERGEATLVLEAVDMAAVAELVLDRLEPVWSTHYVERSITPESFVTGDVAALERIVTNLVSNAVKFSPKGSTVHVTVDGGDRVHLTVDDEGPGVPAGERDRIFVRFFRGSGDAVVRTSGVGIGLSVVQDYVTKMGGQIHVGDSPVGGARFVVEFDRAEDPARSREERSDATT